eukprot:15451624-Alexandrium_andersonii.AAC.1
MLAHPEVHNVHAVRVDCVDGDNGKPEQGVHPRHAPMGREPSSPIGPDSLLPSSCGAEISPGQCIQIPLRSRLYRSIVNGVGLAPRA